MQHTAANSCFAKRPDNNEERIPFQANDALHNASHANFCSQQGYVVFKDYKKVTNKLANADKAPLKPRNSDKTFGLFTAAVRQADVPAAVKAPLSAEIEGIIRSDESWLSFAVIKTPAGQQSYREGEPLVGFDDAYVDEINKDNVVVQYEGTKQTLALKQPPYFKGDAGNSPVTKSKKMPARTVCISMIIWC